MPNTIGIGINYPIQLGRQGYFEQTYDSFTNEVVKLINLMHTVEGERVMQPDFGLGLERYVFEPITSDLKVVIEQRIRDKINKWVPNILINVLTVDIQVTSDDDRNTVFATINFSLVSNPNEYDVITFKLT